MTDQIINVHFETLLNDQVNFSLRVFFAYGSELKLVTALACTRNLFK